MFWKHKIEFNFLLTFTKKIHYNKENNKILNPIKIINNLKKKIKNIFKLNILIYHNEIEVKFLELK